MMYNKLGILCSTSRSVSLAPYGTETKLLAPDSLTSKVPDPAPPLKVRLCTSRTNPASEEMTTFCTSATPADDSANSIFDPGKVEVVLYWSIGRSPRRVCVVEGTKFALHWMGCWFEREWTDGWVYLQQ